MNYYFIIKHKLNINLIIKNDGDIISKIIIGNILKNADLPQDKNIELSKRYQVLSKYTSLYAEIENEKSTQNEMLKIEQKNLKKL